MEASRVAWERSRHAVEGEVGGPPEAAGLPSLRGWLLGAAAGLAVVAAATTRARLPIMLPIVAATGGAGLFGGMLWRRGHGRFPYFEIGVVYAAVVWLYTVFPLVGLLVNGLRFTRFNDMRLWVLQPPPAEIAVIGWYSTAHLVAFVVAYLFWRGRTAAPEGPFPAPDRSTVVAAALAFLAITAYFVVLGLAFDLSAQTYAETYVAVRRLPLLHAQLANRLGGARLTLELVFLAALFAAYRRWRSLIAAWLAVAVAEAFVTRGGRTELMLLLGAAVMMYHHAVRPLRLKVVATGAAAGLGLFLLLGFLRFTRGPQALTTDVNPIFGHTSEFETILSNAYGLYRLKTLGTLESPPIAFYLTDLLALIPQQMLAVAKVSPSTWYVTTFFPDHAAMGAGFAFGTVAESVVGGGWLDAMGRGAALGVIFASVHRWYALRTPAFWRFIFYVWATVSVYNSFRATTFILVAMCVYQFLPVAIVVRSSASVLQRVRSYWLRVGSGPSGCPDRGRDGDGPER
jgi:hypothetical protein